jgi:hypothetical protein
MKININTIITKKCPNGHKLCLSPRCWIEKGKDKNEKIKTLRKKGNNES